MKIKFRTKNDLFKGTLDSIASEILRQYQTDNKCCSGTIEDLDKKYIADWSIGDIATTHF